MGIQKSTFLFATTIALLLGASNAQARGFDPLDLHCSRMDENDGLTYYSEITFDKPSPAMSRRLNRNHVVMMDDDSDLEGGVMSYRMNGSSKQYISGYSLCSITYRDNEVSGLTGDPRTRIDGKFTLVRQSDERNSGKWNFTYTDLNGKKIAAEFNCTYKN